jgi:hypothetical protein
VDTRVDLSIHEIKFFFVKVVKFRTHNLRSFATFHKAQVVKNKNKIFWQISQVFCVQVSIEVGMANFYQETSF